MRYVYRLFLGRCYFHSSLIVQRNEIYEVVELCLVNRMIKCFKPNFKITNVFLLAEKRKSNRSQFAKISQNGALQYPPHKYLIVGPAASNIQEFDNSSKCSLMLFQEPRCESLLDDHSRH